MFKPGDKVHLHDGTVHVVRKRGGRIPKGKGRPAGESTFVRGFVRGALIDTLSGEEQVGDWHENVFTEYGHNCVVKNFVGIAASATSAVAAALTDLALAKYWGIGNHTNAASTNFSTATKFDSMEYALASSATASTSGSRAVVTAGGLQALSGTWSLTQSHSYAATDMSHGASINAIAQYANLSLNNGTCLSLATFASSTKGTTQQLNISYNFAFSA